MLTTSERRGLSLLVMVFALGAARDLWRWHELGKHRPGPPVPHAPAFPPATTAGAPPPHAADRGVATGDSAAAGLPARVDLNRAGAEELDRLPGIGPVLAGRILEHRRRHGPFRDPDELLAVPGIGPKLLERLRSRVRAGPSGSPAPPVGGNGSAGPPGP